MLPVFGLLLVVANVGQAGLPPSERTAELQTGPRFQLELNQVSAGNWENVELRALFQKLSTQRRVAILLDRRVDPTLTIPVNIAGLPLKSCLQKIAHQASAEISIPENVVYIGPARAAGQLRTLIELRTGELQSSQIPERRRTDLRRRHAIDWADLDTPGEVLKQIVDRYQVQLQGGERIPHDLWAGCHLPDVTVAEALSLVLIQFDMTFAWRDGGTGIDLVPIPESLFVERRIKPRGRSAAESLKLVEGEFPKLKVRVEGPDVVVRGTLEEYEAVSSLLKGTSTRPAVKTRLGSLSQRSFAEIKFKRVPVRAVMKKLEESGVRFDFSQEQLKAAGIDLDQTIDLELEKATADEFLKALFEPLKLSFEIDDQTVKLTPKS